MPVRVKPGRLYSFAVRMVRPSGVMANCVGILQQRVRWFAPAKIRKPLVRRTAEAIVRLRWRAARRGDGRLAGYRVYRNGRVHRQVRRRTAQLRLPTGATYRIEVAGLDTHGRVGHRSRAVFVRIGHRPPGRARQHRHRPCGGHGGGAVVGPGRWRQRARGRLPRVQKRCSGASDADALDGGRQPRPVYGLRLHGRGRRQPRLPRPGDAGGAAQDGTAAAHRRQGARVHARLHRRELRGPPAQLPADRDPVPHLLPVQGEQQRDDRQGRPAGHELGQAAPACR